MSYRYLGRSGLKVSPPGIGHHDVRRPHGRTHLPRSSRGLRPGRQLHRHRRRSPEGPHRSRGPRHPARPRRLGALASSPTRWARAPTTGARPASGSSRPWKAACAGWAPITSDILYFHRADFNAPLGEGGARHRRPDPRRQAALFRRVEFPWMAHRRSGAPGRRRRHRPARGQPAAVQPGQPQRRGRAASGGGGLWRGVVSYSPLARGVLTAKYEPDQPPAAGTRGAPGQAIVGNGVASGIAAHRPPHPRLPRHQGHRSRAIRWAGCSTTGW